MRILIIGGTYFLGKAFLESVDLNHEENQVTLINRGNRKAPNNEDGHVRVLFADRHSAKSLRKLAEELAREEIDVCVDFCAYESGDLQKVTDVLPAGVKQYIFVSTCDVYERGTGKRLDEASKFETRDFGGEAGAYILGKVALEKELLECAAKKGMHYTVIRPALIYGPGNYAPREGIYFQWMSKAGQILVPEDADGWFQFVYVKDAARMIRSCLLNENAYDEAFNLCGEPKTYQDLADALEKVQPGLQRIGVTSELVTEKGIPLPFPMAKAESETYANDKALAFARNQGIEFTTLEDGLKESYADFLSQGE